MFDAAHDAALGLPVEHGSYPEGEAGIQKSIAVICRKIREGLATAIMKSYAGNVLKQAGFPQGVRLQAAVMLDHVRKSINYQPDALGTEQIQTAPVSLCIEGAPICIPIGDCDDLVVALGTICAAAGMDVEVIRQFFGDEHQQHVLVQVKTEDGSWFPLDPSSPTMPAGRKANSVRETTHSPWDSSITGLPDQAEFVGIGALPVYVYGRGWRQLPETASLEDGMRSVGAGSIWQGAAMLQPQIDWLGQIWSVVDPSGRSWTQANTDALARAGARNWPANDRVAQSDLTVLILSSAYQARAVSSMQGGQEWSDALTRTWLVLVRKLGYDPSTLKPEDIRARMKNEGATQANLAVFDLLVILVAGLIGAVIYCIAMYAVVTIINNLIAKYAVDQELIRLHSEAQKIVDRHLADPNLPWTDEEKQILKDLEAQQAGLAKQQGDVPNTVKPFDPNAATKDFFDSPWVWVGLAAIVAGGIGAVVYQDEIKRALSGKRK